MGRDELRQRLWPADTFVDFDHSLNTIINKLREVLGDSASNPRFIETLAKRGYRFLVRVETTEVPDKNSVSAPALTNNIQPPVEPPAPAESPVRPASLLTHPADLPDVPHGYVRILFLLIQVMYLIFYIVALARIFIVEDLLQQAFGHSSWIAAVLIVTAAIGIPIRLYLLSAVSFDIKDLGRKFRKLFPVTFVLDELWALSPFLLAPQIGLGLALAVTAALLYVPFSQRTLLLMRGRGK